MPKKKIATVIVISLLCLSIAVLVFKDYSSLLFQLVFNRSIDLKKTDSNINILFLGIGGGEHKGPHLTDTIIFGSINPKQDKITFVSIPRDLWVPELKGRINIAYAEGGIVLAKSIVAKIVDKPINYVVRIDFAGFSKAIDLLGGIDVDVLLTLDDYEYPVEGREDDLCGHKEEEVPQLSTASSQLEAFPCRYTHVHFDKGRQHMNGETALQFVRSRHGQGEEGTDFARSKRQEAVILAIKNKVLSSETLLNPSRVIGLFNTLRESIDTDIQEEEFDDFIRLSQKIKNASLHSVVLDYGDQEKNRPGLLVNPPISKDYDNQWVLIPRIGNGNFSEIQKYVECEIKIGNCSISQNP